MDRVDGTCREPFDGVKEVLDESLRTGEVGASVAVIVDGEPVVDLWGGLADRDAGTPWTADTIVSMMSTTKTMTALCALVLADEGELDLDAPVARYWPEFAAAGKETIAVRHLLSHTSGLSGWDLPMREEDLYDWDLASARLAAQEPWWTPGTASGYHGITFGYLVGEVIRRITGTTVGRFFAARIAEPLTADFQIGIDPTDDWRVARLVPPDPLDVELDPKSIMFRTTANPAPSVEWMTHDGWLHAEVPGANGHGNARSVARVQALMSHGGEIDGIRVLSEKGCKQAWREQSSGIDYVLGIPVRFGLGYAVSTEGMPFTAGPRSIFWGGWGGSLVVNDPEARMTFAYAMNRLGQGTVGDERTAKLLAEVYRGLREAS
jgi:CubicO group peptidase (beta-lactamase class C family)